MCLHSRGAEQWGMAHWLIKKSVLITIHGCLCLCEQFIPLSLHHNVWLSTPSTVTGRPEMNKRNLGCQHAPPYRLTATISLIHPPFWPLLPVVLSNTPMIVEYQSPRPSILSSTTDCNHTTHPLHLCRHTMGSESCLLATNPLEKVAVVLRRQHGRGRGRQRTEEVDRQWRR